MRRVIILAGLIIPNQVMAESIQAGDKVTVGVSATVQNSADVKLDSQGNPVVSGQEPVQVVKTPEGVLVEY